MHVCALHAGLAPAESEDATGTSATGATNGFELPCEWQESNLRPLKGGKF